MSEHVARLIGVYDADGTVLGELSYLVRARLGRAHCALCDITHGRARERADWRSSRERLPVAFDTYHRDDQPGEVRAATKASAPVVVAETVGGRFVTLLGQRELASCDGSPERLVDAIRHAVRECGMVWPAAGAPPP